MKLVTATGYYGTGSSAVTDLLEEYKNIKSLGSGFECRIAHDMNGISDLEYYLVENNHRHNSSIAIKKFSRLMGLYGLDRKIRLENYPAYIGEEFDKYVKEYVETLAPIAFSGGSHLDIYEKSDIEIMILKLQNRIFRMFNHEKLSVSDESYKNHAQTPLEKARSKDKTFITYPRTKFLDATRKFTKELFGKYEDGFTDYLIVDQLIPPTNSMRYVKYFDDVKVISVDRDPRDIYYLEKKLWRGGVVPTEITAFISWYKATRAHKKYETDDAMCVLRINFEDLVLNYEQMVEKIEKFLGLKPENHIRKYQVFNPAISQENIGKWKNDKSEASNIQLIEKELLRDF